MINMIVDYKSPKGQDTYQALQAPWTDDPRLAIAVVFFKLMIDGDSPVCITVIHGNHTLEQLEKIAECRRNVAFDMFLFADFVEEMKDGDKRDPRAV